MKDNTKRDSLFNDVVNIVQNFNNAHDNTIQLKQKVAVLRDAQLMYVNATIDSSVITLTPDECDYLLKSAIKEYEEAVQVEESILDNVFKLLSEKLDAYKNKRR